MRCRAFTLLELIVAFTLVSLLLFFFLDFAGMSKVAQKKADLRTRAESLALRELDENLGTPVGAPRTREIDEGGVHYQISVEVAAVSGYSEPDCRRVMVRVEARTPRFSPVRVLREELVGDLPI